MLSIIIPSYNEEENVVRTYEVLSELLQSNRIDYELLFVNDGSKDKSWELITEVCKKDDRIRGINFSRNFGKEACMFAGLRAVVGDCCVIIDCDLQHPPKTILEMYKKWQLGYEVVEGKKRSRGNENVFHSVFAKLFYELISKATGIDMASSSDFKLLDRKVIDTLCCLSEKNTFFRALSFWCGFKTTSVEYDVEPRAFGETKWSVIKLVRYAINNITSFTAAPLQMVTFLGIALVLCGGVLFIQTLSNWFVGNSVEGFTTVILLQLLIGGSIMISLGVIGHYISRVYDETKGRPQYIIESQINTGTDEK